MNLPVLENLSKRVRELEEELLEYKLTVFDMVVRFLPGKIFGILKKKSLRDIKVGEHVQREMTTLFSDIRSYTAMAEKLSSEDVFRLLNLYFKKMVPPVERHHGYVDKFVGDALLAVYPDSVDDALHSALGMMQGLKQLNRFTKWFQGQPVRIGIGIHYGSITLGMMGCNAHIESTVVGDNVNLASRIESATKLYSIPLIISEAARDNLRHPENFLIREIDHVRVKGKEASMRLFEVFNGDEQNLLESKKSILEDFTVSLNAFKHGDFQKALEGFQDCVHRCPQDSISQIYYKRCQTLIRIPPDKDWQGISGII